MSPERNPNTNRVGPVLAAIRTGVGMSRRGLAEAAGIDHTHLSRVESGERAISAEHLEKVLRAVADRLLRRGEAA